MAVKKPAPKQPARKGNGKVEEAALQGEVVDSALVPFSEREAPVERVINKADVIQPVYNDRQLSLLLARTPKWAIKVRQGPGGNYRYVPHGYVTDTMNKIFGFDWDLIVDQIEAGKMYTLQLVEYDEKTGNRLDFPKRYVAVAGHISVRVRDIETGEIITTITKSGFGSQEWLAKQEFGDALKGARSDLVKTCAYQLGVALDLYWNERAEVESWGQAEIKREEKRRAREIIEQMQSDIPQIPVMLLSKALSEYGLDGEQVAKIIELEDPDDIVLLSSEVVPQKWQMIVDYMEEQDIISKAKETAKSKKKK